VVGEVLFKATGRDVWLSPKAQEVLVEAGSVLKGTTHDLERLNVTRQRVRYWVRTWRVRMTCSAEGRTMAISSRKMRQAMKRPRKSTPTLCWSRRSGRSLRNVVNRKVLLGDPWAMPLRSSKSSSDEPLARARMDLYRARMVAQRRGSVPWRRSLANRASRQVWS
jgi:hypothetical protein